MQVGEGRDQTPEHWNDRISGTCDQTEGDTPQV